MEQGKKVRALGPTPKEEDERVGTQPPVSQELMHTGASHGGRAGLWDGAPVILEARTCPGTWLPCWAAALCQSCWPAVFLHLYKAQKWPEIVSPCAQQASADSVFTRRFDEERAFKVEKIC